ncbi:MAG TPA: sigma factor-like helix-turn-helix DNA-binding protein [Candidatus Limnocylindria bacterium]|nr:sigma factor-like helix-turn-helix DNA-binding protein [Solirubrobacteraceae bacterium]HWH24717.1 sigma factor-like helix-turn-helix DNA-binding protein [Candidatus Limnocylindria bacterium]
MDRENLNRALAALPPLEREVIEMRFGLTGETPRTLQDVVAELNIASERIREIENHALRLLADTA